MSDLRGKELALAAYIFCSKYSTPVELALLIQDFLDDYDEWR